MRISVCFRGNTLFKIPDIWAGFRIVFNLGDVKRLLFNLDKFSEIELDMRDVSNVGQGFADEIFRVFTSQNPKMRFTPLNTNPVINAMLKHVCHK